MCQAQSCLSSQPRDFTVGQGSVMLSEAWTQPDFSGFFLDTTFGKQDDLPLGVGGQSHFRSCGWGPLENGEWSLPTPSLHRAGSCGHKEPFSRRSQVTLTSPSRLDGVSEKLNKASFCVSNHVFHMIPLGVRDAFIVFFGYSLPITDADVGQISHGRRTEGPQTADHPLPARWVRPVL